MFKRKHLFGLRGASIDVIDRISLWEAAVFAVILTMLAIGLILGAMMGPGAEPFRSINHFLLFCATLGIRTAIVVMMPVVILGVLTSMFVRRSHQTLRVARMLLNVSIVMLPLIAVWAAAHALSHVASSNFGIIEGKPRWSTAPAFGTFGSFWVLALLGAVMLVTANRAWRRLCQRDDCRGKYQCIACGYDLRLIEADRCPECGEPIHTRVNLR